MKLIWCICICSFENVKKLLGGFKFEVFAEEIDQQQLH